MAETGMTAGAIAETALIDRLRIAFLAPQLRSRRRRVRHATGPIERLTELAAVLAEPEHDPPASFPALCSTPEPSPQAMPRQDLRRAPSSVAWKTPGMGRRRLLLIIGSLAVGVLFGATLTQVLGRDGLTVWEGLAIALSSLLSAWVGFGFISASAGFASLLRSPARRLAAAPVGRTAILLPTYNEDPGLIFSAVEAIAEDLRNHGLASHYDLFVLSDTRVADIASAEAAALVRLRSRLCGSPDVYYRRRANNLDRKAGNIGSWVEAQGAAYDYMLVLDADSLMSAQTIASLTAAMDADPKLGLLQTVPVIVNAETPFARLQQFASRLYGPIYAAGQAWWSGSEGNYWGHNAIIRVRAFAESAGLPHLSGPKPFGGHILSHDFVEAALLRRRGWAVRTLASLPGSYEETPPTLLDTAARDRRWCQGNLQHARLLGAAGLHWVSRLHLLCGILAYLAPALWLGLLVCGATVWPGERLSRADDLFRVVGLFALSLVLLGAPKVMALSVALARPSLRRGFGGPIRLILGVIAESLISMLTTPVMMVMQAAAVAEVALGRDSGWSVQCREGVELSRRDAWTAHGGHVLLGVFGAGGAWLVGKFFLIWASPVFLSLALSALLSLHTSRLRAGWERRSKRLFRTPEDGKPPPVLARSRELRRAYADEAAVRRRIDQLFKAAAAPYEVNAQPRQVRRTARRPTADETALQLEMA